MKDRKIYLADIDENASSQLKKDIESYSFKCSTFDNGAMLFKESLLDKPDCIIMNTVLHGLDGIEVCRKLRQESATTDIPILFMSENKDEFDVVLGLEVGADDYLVKPVSSRELISRIKAVWRRVNRLAEVDMSHQKLGDMTVDIHGRAISNGTVTIRFPKKEFDLLMLLMENKEKTLSREYLLEQVWGEGYSDGTRTVDVHIRYLRRKLGNLDKQHSYIESVRQSGYRFKEREASAKVC